MTALKSGQGRGLRLQHACTEGGTGALVGCAAGVILELWALDVLDAVRLDHGSVPLANCMSQESL